MTKIKPLEFNDPAPDLDVLTAGGELVRLSALWQTGPLVLAFTRHFGCPQCKEMLDQLFERQDSMQHSGLQLAIVTQATPNQAAAFCAERAALAGAPTPTCLADPQRRLYAAYGLTRGTLRQTILSWAVMGANRRLARRKGYRPEMPPPGQDSLLMSGIFIIGTDGHIRLPYYYDHIADHPVPELLLKGIFATNWDTPLDDSFGPGGASQRSQ